MAEQPALSFGGLLRQLRTEAGLTQEELAEAAGLSTRSVSDLERGVNLTARKDTARLLADALDLTGPRPGAVRGGGARAAAARARAGREARRRRQRRGRCPATSLSSPAARPSSPSWLDAATGRRAGVVGIHAIGGMAGVGKTAFAVHAAHQLADRFPDGQILPAAARAHARAAAGRPGRRAGQPAADRRGRPAADPARPGGAERPCGGTRWPGSRLLLLLDDAAGSEQVRPLLPGTGGQPGAGHQPPAPDRAGRRARRSAWTPCRPARPPRCWPGWPARPGLSPADPAVAEITRLCGCLPLAIGMVARQLHHHPAWSAADLAADLAAAVDRLELMHAENLSVAAAFDLSYQDLTTDQQRLFRRLGAAPRHRHRRLRRRRPGRHRPGRRPAAAWTACMTSTC